MKRLAPRLAPLAVLLALVSCGCQRGAGTAATTAAKSNSPRERLAKLAATYKAANSYQDAGELKLLVDGAPEDEFRSIPFSVAFQRPNKIRIHALDTSNVSDGQVFRSMVQSLPGQVLTRPAPATIRTTDFEADDLLNKAMHGQLGVELPQLTLLTGDDPVTTLTRDSDLEQLSDSEFQGQKCRRISMAGPDGKSVLWIEIESGLLVKFEFPLDKIRKQFPLAKLWAEFRGAKVNSAIDDVAFQVELPEEVKLVKKFVIPPPEAPPALLAKGVDEFTFVDLEGSALGRESLKGKVVVIDMWATWCGWCFEGLPLMEKVYQQYKERDDIVFLAVSKDESKVSNAMVAEAFAKHNLNVPIVRDLDQVTDKVFQLEGLPTTIVLGADGTIQDYYIGYDAKLAETLPAKLEKLLAGENLAQQVLDNYEREKAQFDERLAEVLLDANELARLQPAVASKPTTTE